MLRKSVLASILLLFTLSAFAQRSLIITHDDPVKVQLQPGGGATVTALPDTLSSYAVQPDGSLLLIGSFPTGTLGGAGDGGSGISFIPTRKIAVSGDNRFVYASAAPVNAVSAFSIDGNTGLLTLVPGSPFPTGANACEGMGLAASPNGKTLYAFSACTFTVNASGQTVPANSTLSSFAIGADGSLTKIGADLIVDLPLDMAVSGDGKFLALATGDSNGTTPEATIFSINPDGSLNQVPGSPFPANAPATAFTLTTNFDCSNHLFHGIDGAGQVDSTMEVFNVGANGALAPIAGSPFVVISAAPGVSGGLVGVAIAQGGKVLVGADEFGSAVSFSIAADGTLAQVGGQVPATGQTELGQVTADSSGAFVYSRAVNGIAAFSVDANGNLANVPGSPLPSGTLTAFGTMASFPVHQCVAAPAIVKFGAFNVELDEKTTTPRSFELEGSFILGATSNGIAPLTEAVTVTAGSYKVTVPAGSFKLSSTGSFVFQGTMGGVKVEMSITPSTTIKNKYSFEFEAPVDLSPAGSPVPVTVTVGDDTGSGSVKPQIKTS